MIEALPGPSGILPGFPPERGRKVSEMLRAAAGRSQPDPCVGRSDWNVYDREQANYSLGTLPDAQRAAVLALASDPELDRRESLELVQALCRLRPRERERLGGLYSQPASRGYAIACAMYSMSSWVYHWKDIRDASLEHVVRSIGACIKILPEDPLVPQLQTLLGAGEAVLAAVRLRHDARVRQRYAGMSVREALEQARADMRMEGPGQPGID